MTRTAPDEPSSLSSLQPKPSTPARTGSFAQRLFSRGSGRSASAAAADIALEMGDSSRHGGGPRRAESVASSDEADSLLLLQLEDGVLGLANNNNKAESIPIPQAAAPQ